MRCLRDRDDIYSRYKFQGPSRICFTSYVRYV